MAAPAPPAPAERAAATPEVEQVFVTSPADDKDVAMKATSASFDEPREQPRNCAHRKQSPVVRK
eukprot:11371058-Prorocentrum_lima.AAC.1